FHIRLGLDDFLFFFQLFGRHIFRLADARVYRSDVHGNIAGNFSVAGSQGNYGSDLAVAVDIATNNRTLNLDHTTNRDVLADLLNQRFALGFQIAFHQLGNVGLAFFEGNVQNVVGEVHEVVVAGNEVSFGVHFQNESNGVVVRHLDQGNTFSGGTAGFLGSLQTGRLAQLLDCSFDTAVSLNQSLLALHHAKAGTLTQLFDHCSGNCSHVQSS